LEHGLSYSQAISLGFSVRRDSRISSLHNTLVRLGQDLCQPPEEFKAWSQNLGHEKVLDVALRTRCS
jgi:hypothetical protein